MKKKRQHAKQHKSRTVHTANNAGDLLTRLKAAVRDFIKDVKYLYEICHYVLIA